MGTSVVKPPRLLVLSRANDNKKVTSELVVDERAARILLRSIDDGLWAISRLRRAEAEIAEARDACPALFATVGDRFEIWGSDDERFLLEYLGRTKGQAAGTRSAASCGSRSTRCGKSHVTSANWPMFKQLQSYGRDDSDSDDDIDPAGEVVDRQLFEILGARPMWDHLMFADDGSYYYYYDEKVVCLPPSLCHAFKKVDFDWRSRCDVCRTTEHLPDHMTECRKCGRI